MGACTIPESGTMATGDSKADHEGAEGERQGSEEATDVTGESSETLAGGISSVLDSVISTFETRIEEVVKSQHTLETSMDRLTKVLDKLLEDAPLPLGAQHAAKMSGIRKRVGSLADSIRLMQGLIDSIETTLSDPSLNLSPE